MQEPKPFREIMRIRKSLDDFGFDAGEPEEQASDELVEDWRTATDKLVNEARTGRNPTLKNFTWNTYPHNGTNNEKIKWMKDFHDRWKKAKWDSHRWMYVNHGGISPPPGWKGL